MMDQSLLDKRKKTSNNDRKKTESMPSRSQNDC